MFKMNENEKYLAAMLRAIPEEQILQLDYFKNRGSRFVPRGFIPDAQGERERIYSDVIKNFHEGSGSTLRTIIETDSPEALKASFTLFQWLSTNVGSCVLREALEATGQKIVDID